MSWNDKKIEQHCRAAKLLDEVKESTFKFVRNNHQISEYEVQAHIKDEFDKKGLVTDRDNAIVAFRENTGFVHYYPTADCKKLSPDTLIMIDLWARVDEDDAPFADITWMAYSGKEIDPLVQNTFVLVIKSRDAALKFIRKNLKKGKIPTGKEIDDVTRKVIATAGLADKFVHTTGHSLGFESPHGKEFGLNWKNEHPLIKNLAYTIEPGIYFEDKFGIRSEIDFYINDKLELIITTKVQKELIII
ncbi:MAG: Peptidase M24 [Candidatus Falkowbacteria bacterium GW2011_GWF2_39_8]|uniref:Peptidase M24 n=1 Tax=Candidatus Falkowbacteria bacterium GW2011_GWF2_39_8 TaxID=1618642 RepID=A0A0G0SC96_9BACT|nr:MAG: Peptidase M24 [Candidatus Falkowbacteria bacterium GW2011_GWF2_39_8]